jgi:Effector-associated domain 7
MEHKMGKMQTSTIDPGEKWLKKRAKVIGRISNSPQESTAETVVSTVSSPPNDLLTDLHLPDSVFHTLEKALNELGLQLKPTKSLDETEDEWIRYHMIETTTGKIGLLYLKSEILQDAQYRKSVNSLGYVFSDVCKSLFVFSFSETAEDAYENILRVWQKKLNFEQVDLLLNKVIQAWVENAEKDIEIVIIKIRDRFGLSEEAGDLAEKERFVDTRRLRELIEKHFNEDELRTLCTDMPKIDYENLAGETKTAKIRELVKYSGRRGWLPQLVEYCKQNRDFVSWDKV